MSSAFEPDKLRDRPARPAETETPGKFALLLLIAYLVAKPFYFFASGSAQLADVIFAVLFVITILGRQALVQGTGPLLWTGMLFATYTLVVNTVWAGLLRDLSMLEMPVFYFFNIAVIYVILVTYARTGERLQRAVLAAAGLLALIQGALSLAFLASGQERQTLFFNNPNQLGYFALLSATLFCMLAKHLGVRLRYQLLVYAVFGYIVALSLSKASIIAFLVLGLMHFSRKASHVVLIFLICVPVAYLASDLPLIENVIERLQNIGEQSDDSLHGRGYDRIWLYPQYLLFGAGELGLVRFPETHIELHSTIGTVIFSYGAIGTFLFGLMLWQLLKLSGWRVFLYLVPAFVNGLAHQGLRFSLLWVLFAITAVIGASQASRDRDTGMTEAQSERRHLGTRGSARPRPSDE